MRDTTNDKFKQWRLYELLLTYPGLGVRPVVDAQVRIAGTLAFSAETSGMERIDDQYELEFAVPHGFPRELPAVSETAGRIPKEFHTNDDGCLCLGSPVRQHLELLKAPSLPGFVRTCVIPYLYGFSYREKHGHLPFGELDHGIKGIRKDFAALFGLKDEKAATQMVRLAGMKKSDANKCPCPCGSRRRLGKCHNRRVNHFRTLLGRTWFQIQYQWLTGR